MSIEVCGHLNPEADSSLANLRPCIREPGHLHSHRDRYGLVWWGDRDTPTPSTVGLPVRTYHPPLPWATPREAELERTLLEERAAHQATQTALHQALEALTEAQRPKGAPNPESGGAARAGVDTHNTTPTP